MVSTRLFRSLASLLAAVALVLACGSIALAQDATPRATPAAGSLERAVSWLMAQQGEGGGFTGFTGEPDAGVTADAIVALAAARNAGVDTTGAIDVALAWLAEGDVALVYVQTGVGQAAKLVLALHAAGTNIDEVAGVQPLTIVERGLDPATSIYGTGMFDHALALLALSSAGAAIPQPAIAALEQAQADHGGWAFDGSTDPAMADSNTTSLVIQALAATGHGETEMATRGMAYLASTTGVDGGAWNHLGDTVPDANSTAVILQAMLAMGVDPAPLEDSLHRFQNASGAFHFNAEDQSDNLFATLQAIPALAGAPMPVPGAPLAESHATPPA